MNNMGLSAKKFRHACIVSLSPGDYAVVVPNKITYALDASGEEVIALAIEEEAILEKELSFGICLKENDDRMAAITLLPSMDCNLRCIYCYARGGDLPLDMLPQVATATLNALAKKTRAKSLNLSFSGGGEPFENFELMCLAYERAQELFDEVSLSLVTNGTFATEQLEWILGNHVSTRVSFDGVAHAEQRPFADGTSSLSTVEANIQKLVAANQSFMVQAIVTNKSVHQMMETVAYLADLGVTLLKVEPVQISEISRGDDKMTPFPKDFVENFLKMLQYIVTNNLGMQIDTGFFSRPSIAPYCRANGQNIIVTPTGDITSCVEITRREDPFAEMMLYGQVLVDEECFVFSKAARTKLQNLHFSNYGRCATCNLRLVCGGGCPMKNLWDNGFPPKPSSYTCQIERLLIPRILQLVADDQHYGEVLFDEAVIKVC